MESKLRHKMAEDMLFHEWLPSEQRYTLHHDLLDEGCPFLEIDEQTNALMRPHDGGLLALGFRLNKKAVWDPYPFYAFMYTDVVELRPLPGFDTLSGEYTSVMLRFYGNLHIMLELKDEAEGKEGNP